MISRFRGDFHLEVAFGESDGLAVSHGFQHLGHPGQGRKAEELAHGRQHAAVNDPDRGNEGSVERFSRKPRKSNRLHFKFQFYTFVLYYVVTTI